METDEPRSLKSTFAAAEAKRLSLQQSYDTTSDEYKSTVSSAIEDYQTCLNLISSVSLFSPNELLEDLSTSDLPYLLVNHHLAELVQKLPSSSPRERSLLLSQARDAYERYLHLLDSYALHSPTHKKLLEAYTDSPTTFSTVSAGGDPTARRNAKIANFKAEKELRAKLEFLRNRPEYADFDNEDSNNSRTGGGDEEAVRAVHLANLEYTTHMTFQALESLNREAEMLAMAPDPNQSHQRDDPRHQQQAEDDARRRRGGGPSQEDYSDRLDKAFGPRGARPGGPILSREGKPLQPFTLLGNRQELAKGVFRPGHNLPTMTIDEYLEEERARGGIIEGGGDASWHRPEPDEDDYEKADAETMKAREWDEFVEHNPKGSGNTLNRG